MSIIEKVRKLLEAKKKEVTLINEATIMSWAQNAERGE